MKDNFSKNSDRYAKYRPTYSDDFFNYLDTIIETKESAWDCGTGNGQVAIQLAKRFSSVFATDISSSQLEQATKVSNITYSIQPAEKTNFPNDFFDLIIIAQAIHWFNFDQFYEEVQRTSKEGSKIVVIGYGKLEVNPKIDEIIDDFYNNTIGSYWDDERRYLDEDYQTIPFPFEEIKAPTFANSYNWTLEHLIGYLGTWSAVKHYIKKNNENPLFILQEKLFKNWGKELQLKVSFPMLIRIGIVKKM